MMMPSAEGFEFRQRFRSLEEWTQQLKVSPHLCDAAFVGSLARAIGRTGLHDPIDESYAPPQDVVIEAPNYRESLVWRGMNARQRGILAAVRSHGEVIGHPILRADSRVYAAEAVTPFALYMRGRFPFFLGSEYATDPKTAARLFPVPMLDLEHLDLPDASFDVILTNDVLEHVPHLDRALAEVRRVLVPGGITMSTVPFAYMNQSSVVKARVVNGAIEYLTEPEYHGNPVDPNGSLVFEIPGWDILDRMRDVGFADAWWDFVVSTRYGVIAGEIAGIFVLGGST